jgi:hypothetical protein
LAGPAARPRRHKGLAKEGIPVAGTRLSCLLATLAAAGLPHRPAAVGQLCDRGLVEVRLHAGEARLHASPRFEPAA